MSPNSVLTSSTEPPDALTQALRLPMRALESRPLATFGENFARLVLFIWRTFIPQQFRQWLLKRFNRYLSLQTQLRFRLRTNEKIKFYETHVSDREVVTIDGIKLRSTHLWPRTGDDDQDHNVPHPVCIMRTVYSRKFDFPIARILAERGYHVLLQDTRGHFDSEGHLSLGQLESRDAGCTMRWLSEQPWCDGRVFLIGISIGGYTTWASVAGMLRKTHLHESITAKEGESEASVNKRKPIQVVAAFPLFSSSDILRRGLYVDMEEGRCDPIMRLDLSTRYATFMWDLARPRKVLGSDTLWALLTAILWQIRTETNSFLKRQMYLPLRDVDIAVCEEIPEPRLPFYVDPKDLFWKDISYENAPYELGLGDAVGDNPAGEAPALFFASGWFDIFREQTMRDYHHALEGQREAIRQGKKGNQVIYLMMGPWGHFDADTFFGPVMRETIRVLDHVFADLGREPHLEDPLTSVARVTAFCFGSGGYFYHRLPFYKKIGLLVNPNNPFNLENDSNHCWRYYDCWPPRTSQSVNFVLQPRGKLKLCGFDEEEKDEASVLGYFRESAVEAPPFEEGYDTFVWDPANPTPTLGGATFNTFTSGPQDNRRLEARPDTLVYTSPANLTRDAVEIAGVIKLKMWMYSTAVSADAYARLTLVDPNNGESITMCEGIKRITLKGSDDSWPRLFEVNLGNFCASIEPRWRFRVMIAGGSFPQYSRNLGYGDPSETATRMTKARHRVSFKEHERYSELELPVIGGIKRAIEAFTHQ